MLGRKTSQCQHPLKTSRLELLLEIYHFTDPQILIWSTDVMLCGNFFEELAEKNLKKKKQQQLVNDYILSSNSARKYDYIYIMTDMRTHRVIKTIKPWSHLSFKDFLKKNSILHVAGFLDLPLIIEKKWPWYWISNCKCVCLLKFSVHHSLKPVCEGC